MTRFRAEVWMKTETVKRVDPGPSRRPLAAS